MSASAPPVCRTGRADAAPVVDAATGAPPTSACDARLIPDRGEFIDALMALSRGHVLVHAGNHAGGWGLDGAAVYTAYEPLLHYGLVQEYKNPEGFRQVRYFRLNARGREFAKRAGAAWRQRPFLERLAVRLLG